VPFGGGQPAPRDLALALAILASRTQSADNRTRAIDALQPVERASPNDVEVLLYLAELYRNTDQTERAEPLYRRAIQLDPNQVTASVGLGAILTGRGDYAGAIQLWHDALERNGGLELVRINMAMAQWRKGDLQDAERTLTKAVDFSPGFATPLDLLQRVREEIRRRQ
jgi:Flp pilus assembly protein TadD